MEYTVKRTNRKTLAISIVDGKVIVRAPLHLKSDVIEQALKSKASWIQEKLKLYRPQGVDLSSSFLRVYGENKKLEVFEDQVFSVTVNDTVKISVPKTLKQETVIKKIEAFFKKDLEKYINNRITHYAKLLNIEKPPFIIRRYKRMHGRCNQKGELAFNLYLFHESYDFIDYVVLHECAHILEFNHSKAFYDIIEKHMPDYREVMRLNKL